jgi:DNA-binding phage protein
MRRMTKPYEAYLDRQLRAPEEAVAYLNAALAEAQKRGGIQLFLVALRDVARANNLTRVAGKRAKSRISLYKALS